MDKRTLGLITSLVWGAGGFNWQGWTGAVGGKQCPPVYSWQTTKYACENQAFDLLLPALTYSCNKQRTLCNAAANWSWLIWWGHKISDCDNQYAGCIAKAKADCTPKTPVPVQTTSVSVAPPVLSTSVSSTPPAPQPTVVYGGDQRPPHTTGNGYYSNGACSECLSVLEAISDSCTLLTPVHYSTPPPQLPRSRPACSRAAPSGRTA